MRPVPRRPEPIGDALWRAWALGTYPPPALSRAALSLFDPARRWSFRVDGKAVQQGSHRSVPTGWHKSKRTGRRERTHKIIDDNHATLRPWREQVASAAIREFGDQPPLNGNVFLVLWFQYARPGSHFRRDGTLRASAPRYKNTNPDIDKLTRAILDALDTDAGVLSNDGRVVGALVLKTWERSSGVVIGVQEVP